ncbi:hypothetical protein N7520_008301 [Penicillium odoratum]|uniref:uncharacterized protein n=1 Tax=Penicillium odoratum TaxID=1167516 RepID=UPI0025470457|nr:uncharacterized protein N7520_008301 [Penicillium odoratum]KAJ5761145.1 hypothetical protein N7520_008301 [Penicillium odoratum]
MKVLCLHGKGTSGAIFKSQTSSFRAQLAQKDIQFDFIDGPAKSGPAAGIDLFYPAPYYAFWEQGSVEDIRSACSWLTEYINKHGPYDAVMGFSQGTILASTYLLFHEEETPHLPAPFKVAIFHCGGVSLQVLQELGFNITPGMHERDLKSRNALNSSASTEAILRMGTDRWKGDNSRGGLSEDALRDEVKGPVQISIPTVHVYGSKDPRYTAGLHLSGVCDPATRRCYDHGGGHEIPRRTVVTNAIVELFEWAMEEINE